MQLSSVRLAEAICLRDHCCCSLCRVQVWWLLIQALWLARAFHRHTGRGLAALAWRGSIKPAPTAGSSKGGQQLPTLHRHPGTRLWGGEGVSWRAQSDA